MGTYLNPGRTAFEEAVNSEIFVDKTEMIGILNSLVRTKQKCVSVSRPRRFGKTMAADMICAYYDQKADSRELFSRSRLAEVPVVHAGNKDLAWDEYLGKFDVIRLVMTDFFGNTEKTVEAVLEKIKSRLLEELHETYPAVSFDGDDFYYSIDKFYRASATQFVIVIDEWDVIFRTWKNDKEGQTAYLNFLRGWIKDKPYVAMAYMTGILPIKKYGEHSALNMFTEFSMMSPRQLAPYTAFTEEEVRELCKSFRMSFEEVSDWFDGYRVSDQIPLADREAYRSGHYAGHQISLYSPLSVVESMTTGQIRNYWNKTETYEALAEYINRNDDGLKDSVALLMAGGRVKIDTSTYQNDMTSLYSRDDVLSLLVHLGYLGYDDESGEVFIPNREILDEFRTSTKTGAWSNTFRSFELSQELLKATWNKEEDRVAELIEEAHDRTSNKTYHDEAALSYGIQLAYYAAQRYYSTLLELDTGKGYADIAYLPAPQYPNIPALLIELKYGHDTDAGMKQIKMKKYLSRLEHYRGNILMISINYDKTLSSTKQGFKHHSCRIEEA